MNSVPAHQRGAASGMRGTFFSSGTSLSIGIFFSLMIAGLASTLPRTLFSSLVGQGVPAAVARQVADLPPVGSLFAAFLGDNPIQSLLAPSGALGSLSRAHRATLTGRQFLPHLMSTLFHPGLVIVFSAAAAMTFVGAIASLTRGSTYVHVDEASEVSTARAPGAHEDDDLERAVGAGPRGTRSAGSTSVWAG
jgi:hypothetical protein